MQYRNSAVIFLVKNLSKTALMGCGPGLGVTVGCEIGGGGQVPWSRFGYRVEPWYYQCRSSGKSKQSGSYRLNTPRFGYNLARVYEFYARYI